MVLISIEQRMLLQSQLTALAGRVVEEEGGCNSKRFQGWNNTKLPIMCRSTCYVLFMILNQILWIYRFWAIFCWILGNGPFSSLNQVVTIYHYLFEQCRVGCTLEWWKCLKRWSSCELFVLWWICPIRQNACSCAVACFWEGSVTYMSYASSLPVN
jgi:hypothetical protein